MPRVDTHRLEVAQRGERLVLDAERARAVAEQSVLDLIASEGTPGGTAR